MKIYTLHHDRSHLGDDTHDAQAFDSNQVEKIVGFSRTTEIKILEPIYFQANFETLAWNDYPITDVTWPIISKRILKVLLSIQSFNHKAIPITMLDDTQLNEKYFDKNKDPLQHLTNNNFIVLQLLDHTNGFDWDKSVYKMHRRIKNRADMIRKLVFKEPEGGFPPVFRLSAYPTYVYFSETAKTALEAADIKGGIFEEV